MFKYFIFFYYLIHFSSVKSGIEIVDMNMICRVYKHMQFDFRQRVFKVRYIWETRLINNKKINEPLY